MNWHLRPNPNQSPVIGQARVAGALQLGSFTVRQLARMLNLSPKRIADCLRELEHRWGAARIVGKDPIPGRGRWQWVWGENRELMRGLGK